MSQQPMTPEQIIADVKSSPHDKVKVAITDIDGVLRGKLIHKEKFLSVVEGGFGFCNVVFGWDVGDVAYDNVDYTGWHTGYPDATARLDLGTYRRVPWDHDVAMFLGDFYTAKGTPLPVCPRQVLKSVERRLHDAGFEARVGLEFEWFNFRETPETLQAKQHVDPTPLTPGMFGYSILRSSYNSPFFNALMDQLELFRVPLEGLHTETGPGVYEAALTCTTPLEMADRGVLFKTAAKEIGYRHGVIPTFMARWNGTLPGSSGHIHQSLIDRPSGRNVFYERSAHHGMSRVFQHYLAGILKLLPEMLPFFAPNVNSYKRLVEGYWAPTRATWGIDNRTVALRALPGSEKSTRVELRVGGADINPYLALAATLAAGLYGIENKIDLTEPMVKGNGYQAEGAKVFPSSLLEATERMAESKICRELFGDAFIDHFANTRLWEWRQYQKAITDWELKRYFEII